MLQPDDHKTVRFVCNSLGRTLTAALSGTPNRLDVDKWLMGGQGHKPPTDDQLNRLRFARKMFEEVSAAEDDDTTRNWFMGANVGDNEDTPVTAIREDRFEEVRVSASRIINDEWQ